MRFGPVPVAEAEGAVLAHSLRIGRGRLRKGHRLTAADLPALGAAGYTEIVVGTLETGDISEDDAACRLAGALGADGIVAGTPGTGRCNLTAVHDGLLVIDRAAVGRLNAVDEGLTLATLSPYANVRAGHMVATVKIIPLAVAERSLTMCEDGAPGAVRVVPFRAMSAALIQTRLPGLKESLIEKAVEATRIRLAALGSTLDHCVTVEHRAETVREAIEDAARTYDLVLLLGASAIIDRRDVIPAALTAAGGEIVHFGMPVDPGNLTLVGRLGDAWVLGLPGSARSPRPHGFDWVLERIAAGLGIEAREIAEMGVGGLLKEVPGRPLPRAVATAPHPPAEIQPTIAALVLAAGQSRRMGRENKLLLEVDGKAMVVHAVQAVRAALGGDAPVIVVTGHEAAAVRAALAGEDVAFVHNPDFADGLSTSLKVGLAALGTEVDATLVALADMPAVDGDIVRRLVAAFDPTAGKDIVLPIHNGKRGNPVLWGRRHFDAMAQLSGDVGARHLIGENADAVAEVNIADPAVLTDLDTPEAVSLYRARTRAPSRA